MSEMFHLGFEIDTRPLADTATKADQAARAAQKLGDAEQELAKKAKDAADGMKKAGDEASKAKGQFDDAARSKQGATKSAKDYEQQLGNLTGTLRLNQQELMGLVGALRGQGGLVGALDGAAGMLGRVGAALGPVGIAVGATAVAVGVAAKAGYDYAKVLGDAQDQMGLFDARLKNALGSTSAASDAMQRLYDATQKTGLGFRDTADAFLRIARNGDRLGATTDQLLQLTDTIQKLGAVSGASKGEIGSGMLQLSQALASGKLNGDELRSIMENMPALAKAIADGLGVGVGQMRAMGAAGELTSDKVFKAILKASAQANAEFASLPDTIERSNQRAADAWDKLLATLGDRWNASGLVRNVKNWFTDLTNQAQQALAGATIDQQMAVLQAQRAKLMNPNFGGERLNSAEISKVDAQITALQAKQQAEQQARDKAEKDAADKRAKAPTLAAAELGANEYDDYEKKVKKTRDEVQRLRDALNDVKTSNVYTQGEKDTLIPVLTRYLNNANAELAGLISGIAKAKQDLTDARTAAAMGGGGGGTGIVAQAQQQAQAARSKGGGSLQQFIDVGVQQALLKGDEQIASLDRQTASQQKLAGAVGMTRAEQLELEVSTDTLNAKFSLLGKLGGKDAEAWATRYADALRKSKQAADDLANAQARLSLNDQINLAFQQLGAVGDPYQQRRNANESQAMIAARRDPVQAGLIRQQFDLQETANVRATIDTANRNAAFNRSVTGLSPAEVREAELNRRIADAQRNAPRDQASQLGLAQAMRSEDESSRTRDYANQEIALQRQLKLIQDRQKLIGLLPDEYRVQNALLEKRNQLEAAGAPQDVIDRQLALTNAIERQAIAADKRKQQYDSIVRIAGDAADRVGDAFSQAIDVGMSKGTKAGIRQFEYSFRSAIRKMGNDLTYEIGIKPFITVVKNMAMTFGQKIAGSLGFGGGGGSVANPSGATGADMSLFYASAQGNVFDGVRRFANGGAFTNSIVNSPTLFAFANGGALGLMGEAGPEAVMPLKRGRDGALGVAASGGGGGDVQVVINDMRSKTDAPQIQVAQQRGPDNRRVIQVMVRDEVRRVVRSGELDTEMFNNFGVSRSVARK